MHQLGLKVLKGFLNSSMSLVSIFLSATNQIKVMTLEGTLDFHKKLVGWKGIEFEKLVKVKKDFIENTLEEEGTQAFASGTNEDKCTWERKVISLSRSSISKSIRLRWKKNSKKQYQYPK